MIAIIHHGGCVDGVASAWVAWSYHRSLGTEGIQIIPASYGMPLPTFAERPRLTYVLDFSWPWLDMVELSRRTDHLVLLDHHQTTLDNISRGLDWGPPGPGCNVLPPDAPFAGVLDNTRSGAMITWEFLHGSYERPPALIEYVQDRDLWRWELLQSRQVGSYILTLGETVEEWDDAMRIDPHKLRARGVGAHAFETAAVRSVLKNAYWCQMEAPNGAVRDFPIFASPYILGSTGCEVLMEREGCDMAGYFIERTDGKTQYGFRSRNGTTVNDWAECFPGGGGHPKAAGCTIDGPPIHTPRGARLMTVELICPICGDLQELPEEERDGESEYSLDPCDPCNEGALIDQDDMP